MPHALCASSGEHCGTRKNICLAPEEASTYAKHARGIWAPTRVADHVLARVHEPRRQRSQGRQNHVHVTSHARLQALEARDQLVHAPTDERAHGHRVLEESRRD